MSRLARRSIYLRCSVCGEMYRDYRAPQDMEICERDMDEDLCPGCQDAIGQEWMEQYYGEED